MKSNNILLRANRLNERVTRVDGATVIISANMKKAGVVGRALVVFDYQEGNPLHAVIQFVCVKDDEKVNVTAEGPTLEAEQQRQVLDKITDFCTDFQKVGTRGYCPCDYWLVKGNTEIVDL